MMAMVDSVRYVSAAGINVKARIDCEPQMLSPTF